MEGQPRLGDSRFGRHQQLLTGNLHGMQRSVEFPDPEIEELTEDGVARSFMICQT